MKSIEIQVTPEKLGEEEENEHMIAGKEENEKKTGGKRRRKRKEVEIEKEVKEKRIETRG